MNPYAPPAVPTVAAPSSRAPTSGDVIKWIYLAVALSGPVALVFGLPQARTLLIADLSSDAAAIIGVWWLASTWSSIPADDRNYTKLGRVSALGACLRFLLPVFHIYWAFRVHVMLCGGINDSLARREMPTRAHGGFAFAAVILFVVVRITSNVGRFTAVGADTMVFLWVLEHALWFAYMVQTDTARRIMLLSWRADREAREKKDREGGNRVVQSVLRANEPIQMW